MHTTDTTGENTRHFGPVLDMAIKLAFVGAIVFWCGRIISPFFMLLLWATIIAVAVYPAFLKLKSLLGGRNGLAGAVFIMLSLTAVILPTVLLSDSIIDGTTGLKRGLAEGSLTVPVPSPGVRDWPLVGEKVHDLWWQASQNLEASATKHADKLKDFAAATAKMLASLTKTFLMTLAALVIAGVLMMNAMGGGGVAYIIARRLGGEKGIELVTLSIATIRSVVKGVVLVALIQGLMAAAGLVFAGVPGAGFWAVLVMMLAIAQLPPILILGPIAIYVFSANDSTAVAVIFLVWSFVVSAADGFLKPIFLGRGVPVPMLVILVGAIGGMITAGIIGLFLGAVILSIGYRLVAAWLDADSAELAPKSEVDAEG